MADNAPLSSDATRKAATDQVTYSGDTADVQLTRAVHVSGSEGSRTVVDITAAAGSSPAGALTVQGHASGVALPVSAASLPLPSGAATAAKQPALGTAGSPSSDVITVQGSGSGTALPVSLASVPSHAVTNAGVFATQVDGAALTALQLIDDLVLLEDVAHVSGDPGVQLLAVRKDTGAAVAGTDGDYSPLQLDSLGNLRVNVAAGSASNAAASATGSAVPASADYQGVNVGGTLRGQTGLGVGSHYAVTAAIVDASGNQITSFGGSAGVVSAHHLVAAGSTNAASVKASAGTLRGFHIFNAADYPIYLKIHNTAGTPTAGTGVVRTFGIQAGTRADLLIPGGGVSLSTGIGITLVKDLADNGTTATVANDAVGEIFYE